MEGPCWRNVRDDLYEDRGDDRTWRDVVECALMSYGFVSTNFKAEEERSKRTSKTSKFIACVFNNRAVLSAIDSLQNQAKKRE